MLPLWRLINREAAASFFPYFMKDDGIVSIISPYIVEEGRRDAKKSQRIIFTVGHYIFVAICGDTFYEWRHIKTSSRVKEDYVKVQVGTRVEEIVWEKYLAGVLAKEMVADSELEALKAQAVILRSGFYEKLDHDRKTIFTDDFYSMEELEQEWGEETETCKENLKRAVQETYQMILQYQDQYVMLPYHKLSAGKTRSGQEAFGSESYPYLPARDCPKDLEAKEQLQECVLPYHKVKEKCRKFLTAVENPEETKEDKKATKSSTAKKDAVKEETPAADPDGSGDDA